jgi:DtxR family Mn-dependent transcriptional regulator
MPTSVAENYLKYLFELQQEHAGGRVPLGALARTVGVTPGTCTSMIKKLHGRGLVAHRPYGGARLTAKGMRQAVDILRRHRIMELFLVAVIGIDWADVHAEAERLEHAVSPLVLDRIDDMLGAPEADPHGDPIPSSDGRLPRSPMVPLSECRPGRRHRIVRVVDEAAEFLRFLGRQGLTPGTKVKLESLSAPGDAVVLLPEGGETVTLGLAAAAKIMVAA